MIQKNYWRTTHKFGIRLPHNVTESKQIDKDTGTDYWERAIAKERNRVKIAWEARDDLDPNKCRDGDQLIGYTEIKCHMIFEVKNDFTQKAPFLAGWHMTNAPSTATYSSVVSRESVCIAFLLAALNNLEILACNISNAYLNAPYREKILFLGGNETGSYKDKVLAITTGGVTVLCGRCAQWWRFVFYNRCFLELIILLSMTGRRRIFIIPCM